MVVQPRTVKTYAQKIYRFIKPFSAKCKNKIKRDQAEKIIDYGKITHPMVLAIDRGAIHPRIRGDEKLRRVDRQGRTWKNLRRGVVVGLIFYWH